MYETDDQMLLATCDARQRLRVYRLVINWNYTTGSKPRIPQGFRLEPTLQIAHLHVSNIATFSAIDMLPSNTSRLTQLLILPSLDAPTVGQSVPAEILAALTSPNGTTRIVRLLLKETKDKLHSCFKSLGAGSGSAGNTESVRVSRALRYLRANDSQRHHSSHKRMRTSTYLALVCS